MKIYFQYQNINDSGKSKFTRRLIPELEKLGCEILTKPGGADITLGYTKWRGPTSGKKVLRVNGVHMVIGKKHDRNNAEIRKSILSADYVIYQSEWAKEMANGILNVDPPCTVIYNGARPEDYKDPIESPYEYNVIMSSKWVAGDDRRQKRLPEMIEIAKEYVKTRPHVCFWVAGEIDGFFRHNPQIKILGHLEDKELSRYLAMADVMLHLAWWCPCPNSVVEAICAGCTVIGSDKNGIGEIVGWSQGIPIDIDNHIQPAQIFSNHIPPPLSQEKVQKVYKALDGYWAAEWYFVYTKPLFNIKNTATQYHKVFSEILK